MDLILLRNHLRERRITTLQDIATHFKTTADAITPMLAIWEEKGKVQKHAGNLGCQKGCCQCDPAAITSYQWLD
ncbi:MAG: FeoC-like transcriptional regulator [Deltaproteobacteria bacterium]|jgi:putative ferrous iron transport protein C|nr:FeoC-like transcriptional regulator [Deltaproteobacteria bacterium]